MVRLFLKSLAPDLLLGAGILASSAVAVRTAHSGWLVLAGPAVLAVAVALAALLAARGRDATPGEAWSQVLAILAVAAAGLLVTVGNPDKVPAMMPILGVCAAMPIILRRRSRSVECLKRPRVS